MSIRLSIHTKLYESTDSPIYWIMTMEVTNGILFNYDRLTTYCDYLGHDCSAYFMLSSVVHEERLQPSNTFSYAEPR